jgi:glycosyltransferase involved in cell wall biosynthesis
MIGALRRRGARVGLVFHDPVPHRGARLRHHIRQGGQLVAMRLAARSSDVVVSTIEPDRVPWMQDPVVRAKATLIPVGSCVPPAPAASQARSRDANGSRSVVVFGVTVAPNIPSEVTAREVADIRTALDGATRPSGRVELAVLGRGSADAEHLFRESFADTGVQMSIHGLLPEAEIAAILARADALLCVRGLISTRRTTAVAGVACGTPVVGFCGPETADPITEAGVRLVPYGDRAALASALGSVLSDDVLWHELQCRSRAAYEMYFSWPAIAQRYLEALSDG